MDIENRRKKLKYLDKYSYYNFHFIPILFPSFANDFQWTKTDAAKLKKFVIFIINNEELKIYSNLKL